MPNKRKQLGAALEDMVVKMARAAGLQAKKQPYSGQTKEDKGDVILYHWILAECKVRAWKLTTGNTRTFPLDFEWLAKVERQAKGTEGMDLGILIIHPKHAHKYYAVLDFSALLHLLAQLPK